MHDVSVARGINNQVKCMCFDTTAANTGPRNGACILLEQKLCLLTSSRGKDMLWSACRYHILEIILEAVVLLCLGHSSGPDIPPFKRFQKSWVSFDSTKYHTAQSDKNASNALTDITDERIVFCKDQLQTFNLVTTTENSWSIRLLFFWEGYL